MPRDAARRGKLVLGRRSRGLYFGRTCKCMGHGGAKGREFMGDTSQADQCVGVGVCGLVGAFQCQKLCVAHVPFQKMSCGLRAHLIPQRHTAPGQLDPFNCLNILGMPVDAL